MTRTASASSTSDLYATITAKIIDAIETGAGEFQMPWHRPGVSFAIPKNALTQKAYRGTNVLGLWIDADDKKFEHQVWATYRQWQELGAQVRKGEKSSLIVKYGEWIPKQAREETGADDADDDGKRLYARAAHVFNVTQVDGYDIAPVAPRPDLTIRLAHVDAFLAATGAEFREGGQRAFYRHRGSNGEGDFIQMPPRNLFTGTATCTPTESYESTRLHEAAHNAVIRIMPHGFRERVAVSIIASGVLGIISSLQQHGGRRSCLKIRKPASIRIWTRSRKALLPPITKRTQSKPTVFWRGSLGE